VIRSLHATALIAARVQELVGSSVTVASNDAELAAAIPEAELFLITDNLYSADVARILGERARNLKWIQLLSAGYDAVARHGFPAAPRATKAGDPYPPSVATKAIALLLGAQRRFPPLLANQARHAWDKSPGPRCTIPFGSTVAVLGFGHIGS